MIFPQSCVDNKTYAKTFEGGVAKNPQKVEVRSKGSKCHQMGRRSATIEDVWGLTALYCPADTYSEITRNTRVFGVLLMYFLLKYIVYYV